MKIAYLIAAHTDPEQLLRLVSSLQQRETDFYVHIDKKTRIEPFINKFSDGCVKFINERVCTHWGGYSQCKYQYNLIKACVESGKEYDRIFFLSGLDYPLWSNHRITTYLESHPDTEFIKGMNLSDCCEPPKMQTRIRLYHLRDLPWGNATLRRYIYGCIREILRLLHIVKKNRIKSNGKEYTIYCGSSWWCLTYKCLKYVYKTMNQDYCLKRYFKTCLAPDEMLIQTIIFNSAFADKALLYRGNYPGLVGLTPLHYIEYTNRIATYTEKDFDKLIMSGKMFCRKLQSGVSEQLIDRIDAYRNEKG